MPPLTPSHVSAEKLQDLGAEQHVLPCAVLAEQLFDYFLGSAPSLTFGLIVNKDS